MPKEYHVMYSNSAANQAQFHPVDHKCTAMAAKQQQW
jgi:hypothetical protein